MFSLPKFMTSIMGVRGEGNPLWEDEGKNELSLHLHAVGEGQSFCSSSYLKMPRQMTTFHRRADSPPLHSAKRQTTITLSTLSAREIRILDEIISTDSECAVVSDGETPRKKWLRKRKSKNVTCCTALQLELQQMKRHLSDKERELCQLKNRLAQLEHQAAELLEEGICKICYDAPIECVLVPCLHQVVCRGCREQLDERCPICRVQIHKTGKVYRS